MATENDVECDLDGNISDLSLGDENEENEIPRTSTPRESRMSNDSSRSTSFKKYPELSLAFERTLYDANRMINSTCRGCKLIFKSNKMSILIKHGSSCDSLDESVRERITSYLDTQLELDEDDKLLTKCMLKNMLPFRLLSCKYFRQLINKNNPDRMLVSRTTFSEQHVAALSREASQEFFKNINEDYTLSIEFDHYEDYSHRHVLGVLSTNHKGNRYLHDLFDVSIAGKSAAATEPLLMKTLKKVPIRAINSIISDSASNCVLTKRLLIQKEGFKHVIAHRCIAHWLNNIGQKFTDNLWVNEIITEATQLTTSVNNHLSLSARLKQLGAKRLTKATSVRWYSNVDMVESLIELKPFALDLEPRGNDNIILDKFREPRLFANFRNIVIVLRPLANCIAQAEKAKGSLGEAVKAFFEFVKVVLATDRTVGFFTEALSAVLNYFNEKNLGEFEMRIMLAAYFLDRRNKMDYITNQGKIYVFKAICEVAQISGYESTGIECVLPEEFKRFMRQEGSLGTLPREDQSSYDWWRAQPSNLLIRTVAMRLANLRSSSANLERVFSMVKLIQCPIRTRFKLETVRDLIRSRLKLADDEQDRIQLATLTENTRRSTVVSERTQNYLATSCSQQLTAPVVPLSEDEQTCLDHIKQLIDFSIINTLACNTPQEPAEPFRDGVDRAVKKLCAEILVDDSD